MLDCKTENEPSNQKKLYKPIFYYKIGIFLICKQAKVAHIRPVVTVHIP